MGKDKLKKFLARLRTGTVFDRPAPLRILPPVRHSLLLALEPRLVFDGAVAATVDAAQNDQLAENNDDGADAPDANDAADLSEQAGLVAPTARVEIAFVDRNIRDVDTLIADIEARGMRIVYLDPAKNGVTQIGEVLAQYAQIDAIHIFSHAEAGEGLILGGMRLTEANVASYQEHLAIWGEHLKADADILLYGCDLAGDNSGRALVDAIAEYTDADVAASSDLTGSVLEGGDWDLEYRHGDIETEAFTSTNFTGVMAAPTLSGWSPEPILYTDAQAGPVLIDSNVSLASGLANFNNWELVLCTSGGTQDQLSIRNQGTAAGQIGVSGGNITWGGVAIGTFTGGANGADLRVTLNASATTAAVEALIENLSYQNTGGAGYLSERALTLRLNDPAATGGLTYVGMIKDNIGGVDGLDAVWQVIQSPDGKYVYAAGRNDNSVSVFSRNETTGVLTYQGLVKNGVNGVTGITSVSGLTMSADGRHLYVSGSSAPGSVAFFSRDETTGALTFMGALEDGVGGVNGLQQAESVGISPDGKHVYVMGYGENAVAVFSRNETTGILTYVSMVTGVQGARHIAFSADGLSAYVVAQNDYSLRAFSRNATTGALTAIGSWQDNTGGVDGIAMPENVIVSADGRYVYVSGSVDDAVAIFSRNLSTGVLTYSGMVKDGVGGVDGLDGATGITISDDGKTFYVASITDNSVAIFSRNITTGALTYQGLVRDGVGGVDGLDRARTVTVSADGRHVYVGGQYDDAIATFTRDGGDSAVFTTQLTVVDTSPLVTGWSPSAIYLDDAQDAPRLIDNKVIFTSGYANFNGWKLALGTTGGGEDQLAIRNQGTGAGEIGISGSNVTYGGTVIGTFTGGVSGARLTVTLNASANNDAVEALIENFTYFNTASGAATASRSLNLQLIDPTATHTLSHQASFVNGTGGVTNFTDAEGVKVSPDGKYVYVYSGSDFGSGQSYMQTYARNPDTGVLTFVRSVSTAVIHDLTFSPDGKYAYARQGTVVDMGIYNADTGVITFGTTAAVPGDVWYGHHVIVSDDGNYVYISGSTSGYDASLGIYARASNGVLSYVGFVTSGGTASSYEEMLISADGKNAYVISQTTGAISSFTRDPLSGALTFQATLVNNSGGVTGLDQPTDVAISNDGRFVYVTTMGGSNRVVVFERNLTTGALSFVSSAITTSAQSWSVEVSDDGDYVIVASTSGMLIYSRNATTGLLTLFQSIDVAATGAGGFYGFATAGDGRDIYAAGLNGSGFDPDGLYVFKRDLADSASFTADLNLLAVPQVDLDNWQPQPTTVASAQGGPVLIDNDVTINTALTNLGGWVVTLATTGGAEDQLAIRNQGTGAGQIGVSGANITYAGTLIGTFTGGVNGADLVITLNASATPAALEALTENLTYRNTATGEVTVERTMTLELQAPDDTTLVTTSAVSAILSAIVVSADGNHAYAAGPYGTGVQHFTRNTTTGALTAVNSYGTASYNNLGISPDGRHVYGISGNSIQILSRNTTTGVLTPGTTYTDGNAGFLYIANASAVMVSPNNTQVYVVSATDNAVTRFTRNTTTGALSGAVAYRDGVSSVDGLAGASHISMSANGATVYVTGRSENALAVFTRNTTTGNLTFNQVFKDGVSGVDGLAGASWSAVSPDGTSVYVAGSNENAISIFSRNTSTGALTYVGVLKDGSGGIDGIGGITSLIVSADNQYVYAAGAADHAVAIFKRNTITGALTYQRMIQNSVPDPLSNPFGDSFYLVQSGNHVYNSTLYTINTMSTTPYEVDPITYEGDLVIGNPVPPGLVGWSPAPSTLNAAQLGPVIIDADVTITGTMNYNSWQIVLKTTGGTEDRLSIRNQGTGAGQIGVSGGNITYGGVTIGSYTGGNNGADLVILLNSAATNAAVEALVENLTYQNTPTNAPALQRNLMLQFNDPISTNTLGYVGRLVDGVGGVDGLDGASGVKGSPDGKHIYVTSSVDDSIAIFTRAADGSLTYAGRVQNGVGGVTGLDGASFLTVSPDGKNVYALGYNTNTMATFSRDADTGALTFIATFTDGVSGVNGLSSPNSILVTHDGLFAYTTGYSDQGMGIYSRNTTTGALSFLS